MHFKKKNLDRHQTLKIWLLFLFVVSFVSTGFSWKIKKKNYITNRRIIQIIVRMALSKIINVSIKNCFVVYFNRIWSVTKVLIDLKCRYNFFLIKVIRFHCCCILIRPSFFSSHIFRTLLAICLVFSIRLI